MDNPEVTITIQHLEDGRVAVTILDTTYRMDAATAYDFGKMLISRSGWDRN